MFFFLTTTRTEERMSMVNSRRFAFSSSSKSLVVVIIAGKKRATEISLSGVVFRYREDGEAKAGKRDVILCARTCVSFSCISEAFFL